MSTIRVMHGGWIGLIPSVICDRKTPLELKEDFYCITIRLAMLYEIEYRVAQSQQESKLNVVEMRMLYSTNLNGLSLEMIHDDIIASLVHDDIIASFDSCAKPGGKRWWFFL